MNVSVYDGIHGFYSSNIEYSYVLILIILSIKLGLREPFPSEKTKPNLCGGFI